jgi:phosphohistidine swiveling domain-containing protein
MDKFDRVLNRIKNREIWPLLNNNSVFYFFDWNHYKNYSSFKDKTDNICILALNKEKSFSIFVCDKLARISKEFLVNFFKNPNLLSKKIIEFYKTEKEVEKLYNSLSENVLHSFKISQLNTLVKDIKRKAWLLNGRVHFSVFPLEKSFFVDLVEEKLINIKISDIEAVWDKAVIPLSDSFDKKQYLYILGLLKKKISWQQIVKKCQYFYANYQNVLSLEEVDKKLSEEYKDISPLEAEKSLNKEKREKEKKEKDFQNWLKNLNKKQKDLVFYLQTVIDLRDERKKVFNQSFVIMNRIAKEIFSRAKVEEELIPFISVDEISKGIKAVKKMAPVLRRRTKGYVVCSYYGKEYEDFFLDYNLARKKAEEFYNAKYNKSGAKLIKGVCGNKGLVKGRVKKILYHKDFNDFKDGDVLVAGMTRVEYISLMKRASAIITDEGGLTCHAAIVSRELGIPCVIGTKIATSVLNDGDVVEVNATEGTVKQIK